MPISISAISYWNTTQTILTPEDFHLEFIWGWSKNLNTFSILWFEIVETQNLFVGIVGQLFGNCILFCHKILKWEKLPRIFTISKWAHQNKLTFLWRNWVHIFPVHRIKCLIGFDFHVESFSSFPSMQTYNIIQKNLVCKLWKDIELLSTREGKSSSLPLWQTSLSKLCMLKKHHREQKGKSLIVT